MRSEARMSWTDWNQAVLVREFSALLERLGGEARRCDREEPWDPMDRRPAIDELGATFGLDRFERDLLLLCAGVEMDSALARHCQQLTGNQRYPVTFGLALGTLPEAHWSALAPSSPLRRFRLIDMDGGHGFAAAPLHINERILHYLAGLNAIDTRLQSVLREASDPALMARSHLEISEYLIQAHTDRRMHESNVYLFGDDASGHEGIAAFTARHLGRALFVLRAEDIPSTGAELDEFVAVWTRETLLLPAWLLLQYGSTALGAAARQLERRLPGPLFISSRAPLPAEALEEQYEINKPDASGQRVLWDAALGNSADGLGIIIDQLSEQFRLSSATIAALGATVHRSLIEDHDSLARRLWDACCSVSRPQLESLAQRVVPIAQWSDLILPPFPMQMLRQLAAQSRQRMTVYERWGFAAKGRRGLGMSALFSGPSGTGKTLAAEVLANDLRLDLYRVDLSAVVSKYIGETEKNLAQVFDAAETGGLLLVFDEADSIFGKRAEVKDSHDRYANIEVGYLLQRMESFQGIAILTTNTKSVLDKAFQRRLRFTIDFQFPGTAEREAIWRRVFPEAVPTQALEPALLANLNMAGGNIRNIALNAAFLAAEQHKPVQMGHLLVAAQLEAVKVERPIADAEIRGWV
jgi:predicted nucleic acid-binding protein